MNKKIFIFGLFLVFAFSLASAGMTGHVLKEGESIPDSSVTVNGIESGQVEIEGETYSEGDTFEADGKTYEVKAVEERRWIFGSDKVEIEKVEKAYEGDEIIENITTNPNIIMANACNADEVCEVNGRLMSEGPIGLTSKSGSAKIEADLTLTKIGQSGGVVFRTNDAGSLAITPSSGSAKIEADLTLTKEGYSGAVIFASSNAGDLTITPSSGSSTVVGNLIVTNLANGNSSSFVLPAGDAVAYVCVSSEGVLFRSPAPCV